MISALKLLANVQEKENFLEVFHDGIKEKDGAGIDAVH